MINFNANMIPLKGLNNRTAVEKFSETLLFQINRAGVFSTDVQCTVCTVKVLWGSPASLSLRLRVFNSLN